MKIFACRLAVLHTIMNLHCVHIILHSRFYFSSFHFFLYCSLFSKFCADFYSGFSSVNNVYCVEFYTKKNLLHKILYGILYLQIIMNHDTEENGKTCTSSICCIICMQNSYFVSGVTNLLYTFLLLQYTLYLQQ